MTTHYRVSEEEEEEEEEKRDENGEGRFWGLTSSEKLVRKSSFCGRFLS